MKVIKSTIMNFIEINIWIIQVLMYWITLYPEDYKEILYSGKKTQCFVLYYIKT